MKQEFEKMNILSKYIKNNDVLVHEEADVANRILKSLVDLKMNTSSRNFGLKRTFS